MTDTYVHAIDPFFHPNKIFRVVDAGTVAERGWTSASGMWGLPESDRQVCPRPDARECGCVVVQRDSSEPQHTCEPGIHWGCDVPGCEDTD